MGVVKAVISYGIVGRTSREVELEDKEKARLVLELGVMLKAAVNQAGELGISRPW